MRITEIYWSNKWIEVAFESLKKGDVFRVFEPDGKPVRDRGATVFVATSDAFYSEDFETYMVRCETYYGLN